MGEQTVRTPWHLWVVGGISLLWNGFGSLDFTMSALARDAWFSALGVGEEIAAQVSALPGWMWGVWMLGVYGGLAGAILLLVRRRLAVQAFAVSLFGAAVSAVHGYLLSGEPAQPLSAIIVVLAGLQLWYAWAMTKKAVLR